jgi:hypothetical protein
VLAGAVQRDEVRFLTRVELGPAAAQASLGVGDAHALPGSQQDQVRLKLGDHRQHVEQKPPNGISRVMDRAADAELDLAPGEVFENLARVRQRPRQAIELGDDKCVAAATRGERLAQAGTLTVGSGQAVIDVGALGADAEYRERVSLRCEVLIVSRDTGVTPPAGRTWSSSFGQARGERRRHGPLERVKPLLRATSERAEMQQAASVAEAHQTTSR